MTKNIEGARQESLNYQLDLLKMEIEKIDALIARMDEMAQSTKNWAISLWTGSIAAILTQADYREYLFLSAVPPLLFWYLDAYFRRLQTRSILRMQKIREFLNSEKLTQSFEIGKLVDITVLDPTGTQYRGTKEYKEFASIKRTLQYPEVRWFYLTLIVISLGLGTFFLLTS
jgi:hypothetical protein